MSEEWVPCREFPDHYEISSLGRVRRKLATSGGRAGRVRKGVTHRTGYVQFMLSAANRQYMRDGHRLVADAFLGPIPPGMQVNHKNGDKGDNRVENLEVVSNGENRAHSYRVLGVRPNGAFGERNRNAKFGAAAVSEIREAYKSGRAVSELARQFGVTRQTIYRIGTGRGRVNG